MYSRRDKTIKRRRLQFSTQSCLLSFSRRQCNNVAKSRELTKLWRRRPDGETEEPKAGAAGPTRNGDERGKNKSIERRWSCLRWQIYDTEFVTLLCLWPRSLGRLYKRRSTGHLASAGRFSASISAQWEGWKKRRDPSWSMFDFTSAWSMATHQPPWWILIENVPISGSSRLSFGSFVALPPSTRLVSLRLQCTTILTYAYVQLWAFHTWSFTPIFGFYYTCSVSIYINRVYYV